MPTLGMICRHASGWVFCASHWLHYAMCRQGAPDVASQPGAGSAPIVAARASQICCVLTCLPLDLTLSARQMPGQLSTQFLVGPQCLQHVVCCVADPRPGSPLGAMRMLRCAQHSTAVHTQAKPATCRVLDSRPKTAGTLGARPAPRHAARAVLSYGLVGAWQVEAQFVVPKQQYCLARR